jgi:hypothetical protein
MDKPYTKSVIMGIVGNKGAGKSLYLAHALTTKLAMGETVWSNMPVKIGPTIIAVNAKMGQIIKPAEAEPLDWNLLYKLDESMAEGTVGIDEITYFVGSRQSMETRNRLINACVRQVRHRCLDLFYTAKSFHMVDAYLREETDIIVVCKDLSYEPWGKANHLKGGEMINFKLFDYSGVITGKSIRMTPFANNFELSGRGSYFEANLEGRPLWECYDTRHIISIEEAFTGVKMNFKKREIGNQDEIKEGITDKIKQAIRDFKNSGQIEVPTFAFWEYLKSNLGLNGLSNNLARYLPYGVKKRNTNNGRMYDFGDVEG